MNVVLLFLLLLEPFHLEHSPDGFGLRSHGIMETLPGGHRKFYRLPQSPLGKRERSEVIGPHQIEGDKIWFGKQFYYGEGMTGEGAFGYFDTATRQYTLFSPPAVTKWEISAILVQPECVWLALDHFGESIPNAPGGLIQWNRTTHAVQHFDLEFVVLGIRPQGDSMRLDTQRGYAIFHDGELHRYLANGKPVAKFRPLPSNI